MSYVWVILHFDGEENPKGRAFEIESQRNNCSALAEAVKAKLKNQLSHVDPNELEVYANVALNDLKNALKNATPLDPGDPVPGNTSSGAPLIVTAPSPPQQLQQRKKKQKLSKFDFTSFHSPLETRLPVVFEDEQVEPFLAPTGWLEETAAKALEQANAKETDNPRVSPIALIRCSRGGKTRSMIELAKEIRNQDPSYGIVYITFNTDTPLSEPAGDPTGEICVRIAFAAFKNRTEPRDPAGFSNFLEASEVDKDWVEDWLKYDKKCIVCIDELNLLQDSIDAGTATFLKTNFLLPPGRGLIFSSHVASMNHRLTAFMSSPSDRQVVTIPLPIIPSLQETRTKFDMPDLSVQDALYLGLLPGLIVERKRCRAPRERRINAVTKFLGTVRNREDIYRLLRTLLTGDAGAIGVLQELTTADLEDDGKTMILRWVPFHMEYVIGRLVSECAYVEGHLRKCLESVKELFRKFAGPKWGSGDAWEALFLIVLIVRCLTASFDAAVVPLGQFVVEDNLEVAYNRPLKGVNFYQVTNPVAFVDGIPLESWAPLGTPAISIYYPGNARFEAYDVILAFWDAAGNRLLYGYQLKEGSTAPAAFAYNKIFEQSYLIRGAATQRSSSVRGWQSVSDSELDNFFGVSAMQWSPKQWRKLSE